MTDARRRRGHPVAVLPLILAACAGVPFLGSAIFARASAPPASTRPDILLITVDTLRPDALGWVSGKNATPAIDALAAQGIRFRSAVAPVPLTLPSHASLMTGLIPRRHGVRDNGQVLGANSATLVKRLRERGYATGAFVSGYPLRKTFGLDAGFDLYDDRLNSGAEGWVERVAGETTAAALAWVTRAKSPWFLWIHYYDPHDPYTPPRQFLRPGSRGAYDGEVAYVDSAISELLRRLPSSPSRPRITVLTGDHGESLGEHGENGHGFFLYDTTVLVPMIFHAPGRLVPREEKASARVIDVAPTLLEMAGLPPLQGIDGRSLVPLFEGKTAAVEHAYIETQEPWIAYGWSPLSAIRDARWKLVEAPRPELYDLSADPGERSNVLAENRPKTVALLKEMRAVESRRVASSHANQDAEAIAKLRSLGYLGAGSTASTARPPGKDLPDPKDRIAERNMLLQGEALLRRGALDQAITAFSGVLQRDPHNRFALLRTGIALLKKGSLREAIPPLEEAVRLDPDQAENRFALADALTRTGQFAKATPHWMEAARLQPRRVAAWSNLGTALGQQAKWEQAIGAFAQAVAIDPGDPLLLANLAFAERAGKREADALTHLRKAASLSAPDRFPYPASLGLLLVKSGNAAEARPWLERSRPQEPDFGEARFELARLQIARGEAQDARRELALALATRPALRKRAEMDPLLRPLMR